MFRRPGINTFLAVSLASEIMALASLATLPWFIYGRVRETRSRRNGIRQVTNQKVRIDPGMPAEPSTGMILFSATLLIMQLPECFEPLPARQV